MKRKLLLANLALLAAAVGGAVHLRREWAEARTREQAVLGKRLKPAPAPRMAAQPAAEAVKATVYSDIAQKMLFSKDRNPTVVVEPPPPPKVVPVPPLPLFHGVVNLGDGPIAIMSLGKGPHRDFQPGDQVGEFTLVAVEDEELVLEWKGKTIRKRFDEILDRGAPAPQAGGPTAAAAAAAQAPKPVTPAPAEPGADLAGGMRACQAGDSSPAGTVADGMRKVIKPTPFGSRCYWESAK